MSDADVGTDTRNGAGSKPVSDHAAAIDFLQVLRPGGPWLLIAIDPGGCGIVGQTCNSPAEALAFVATHDQRCNLYYSVAETRPGLHKKATKNDVECACFLWTEIDPHLEARGGAETDEEFVARIASEIAAEKAKALGRARSHRPPPSIIVDSGNGIQLLWRLDKSYSFIVDSPHEAVRLHPARFDPVERRNKHLLAELDGDGKSFNVDRILPAWHRQHPRSEQAQGG
jgi:hypothetical protein